MLGESLSEIHHALSTFSGEAAELERWLGEASEALNETTTLAKVDELCNQRNSYKDRYEATLKDGRALISKKDVTDTGNVRDRIKVSSVMSSNLLVNHLNIVMKYFLIYSDFSISN